jgi:hypothetical protein
MRKGKNYKAKKVRVEQILAHREKGERNIIFEARGEKKWFLDQYIDSWFKVNDLFTLVSWL